MNGRSQIRGDKRCTLGNENETCVNSVVDEAGQRHITPSKASEGCPFFVQDKTRGGITGGSGVERGQRSAASPGRSWGPKVDVDHIQAVDAPKRDSFPENPPGDVVISENLSRGRGIEGGDERHGRSPSSGRRMGSERGDPTAPNRSLPRQETSSRVIQRDFVLPPGCSAN